MPHLKYKLYTRTCRKCNQYFKTKFHLGKVCSKCYNRHGPIHNMGLLRDSRNSQYVCIGNHKRALDPRMARLVEFVNKHTQFETLGCCSGHGKYPPSLVLQRKTGKNGIEPIFELFSGKTIPRKKRFYLKNRSGYYFIPEVLGKSKFVTL